MTRSSGTRLGPYELTALLGAGGMGQVYEAHDTRLGRDVAIKLLPVDTAVTPEARQRLEREARAVAALQHPNICTLFDVGETPDGHFYLVMERLHGETVRERLSRGTMAADEVIDLAVPLADALETAHAAGIVHRDLKPANIMLTPRGPKILDFGVAKTPAAVPDALTATGFVTEPGNRIGTVAYMSPEQLRGEAVDARSDLFSFGLVLYEMMTGRRAFSGDSATAVPATLEAVVRKALEQDRALRYQHAAELRSDLLRIKRDRTSAAAAVAPPATARRTTLSSAFALTIFVAVVATASYLYTRPATAARLSETDTIVLADFANSTGDPVFDGTLRQALSVQLQQSPFLSLVPDTRIRQTLRLMGQSADVPLTPEFAREVCERSGGAAVLDGSIAPLGSQLVIGLRARHCETGEILDEQQAQVARKEDVLNALSTMATVFRTRVGESLVSIERYSKPLVEATTPSLDALKAYSEANRLNTSLGSGADAVPSYRRALDLDPQFAMAHAELGLVYDTMGESGLAREHTVKAYELRHRASERERFQIATLYERQVTGNLENARQLLEQWVQAYPRDRMAHGLFAGFTTRGTGRYERTIEESEKLIALEPDNGYAYGNIASANVYLDRFDEAERALARAESRKIPMADAPLRRFELAFLRGDDGAMAAAVRSADKSGSAAQMAHLSSLVSALRGELRQARTLARQAIELEQRDRHPGAAATYAASEALWEAVWGNADAATTRADSALSVARGRDVDFGAALAFGLAGETRRLPAMIAEMSSRFPDDTSVQSNYLPSLRALVALAQRQPAQALEALAANTPYEHARPALAFYWHFGGRYPAYLRGVALLADGRPREAAAAFEALLNRRGLLLADPLGALARVQLGRAYAKAGDIPNARAAYESFLALTKDADGGLLLATEARRELAQLK